MSLPEELFGQIGAWLSELPGLSEECQAIRLLESRRSSKEFHVAIAGGISRGKTRLLNSLLETSIFPEGSIPTTTVLTEVAYGKEPEVVFESRSGETILPPDSASLERFSSDGADADSEGFLRVKWPAPFLEPGLILHDTPGIDDVFSQRANLAFSVLEEAEGAIVVVSANVPVSMLERDFIQTYLENRAVPHIAVAISFLDNIDQENMAHQIRFIENRVKRIAPDIEIWLTDACCPGDGICGATAIRDRLSAWVQDPARQELRDQRDLQLCSDLITGCLGRLEEQLAVLEAEQADRRSQYHKAGDNLDQQKDVWQELRQDFLARSQYVTDAAKAELEKLRCSLKDAMRSVPDDTFPQELRQRLAASARSLSDLLRERLEEDTTKLRQDVGQNFGFSDLPGLASTHSFAIGYTLPEVPDKNMGDILAMLINYARGVWKNMGPMLPLPAILRGAAQEMVDRGLKSLAAMLGASIDNSRQFELQIDAFFDGLQKQLGDSITALYAEKAEYLRGEQERWLEAQREMMAALRTPEQVEAKMAATRKESARGRELLAAVQAGMRPRK